MNRLWSVSNRVTRSIELVSAPAGHDTKASSSMAQKETDLIRQAQRLSWLQYATHQYETISDLIDKAGETQWPLSGAIHISLVAHRLMIAVARLDAHEARRELVWVRMHLNALDERVRRAIEGSDELS